MSAFAPGPWVTDPELGHEMVLDANGVLVADCSIVHRRRTTSQCVAHAALIAAAPDLCAALSNLLADLAPIVNEFHNGKINGGWPPTPGDARAVASELVRISAPARTALAKAKGAQS